MENGSPRFFSLVNVDVVYGKTITEDKMGKELLIVLMLFFFVQGAMGFRSCFYSTFIFLNCQNNRKREQNNYGNAENIINKDKHPEQMQNGN